MYGSIIRDRSSSMNFRKLKFKTKTNRKKMACERGIIARPPPSAHSITHRRALVLRIEGRDREREWGGELEGQPARGDRKVEACFEIISELICKIGMAPIQALGIARRMCEGWNKALRLRAQAFIVRSPCLCARRAILAPSLT